MANTDNIVPFDRQRVDASLVRVVSTSQDSHSGNARTSTPNCSVVRGMVAKLVEHLGSLDRSGLSDDMRDRATVLKAMAEHFLEGFDEPDPKRSA